MERLTMPVTPAAGIQLPLLAPLGTTIKFTSPHPNNFFFFKNTNKVLVLFQFFLCCILQTHLKKKNLYPSYFFGSGLLLAYHLLTCSKSSQCWPIIIRLMCSGWLTPLSPQHSEGCVVHREWCFCDGQIKILNVLHTNRKAKYWQLLVSFPHVNYMPKAGWRRWEWFSKRCVLGPDFWESSFLSGRKQLLVASAVSPHVLGGE